MSWLYREHHDSIIHKCYRSVQTLCTSKVAEKSYYFSSAAIITALPLPKSFPSLPSTLLLELLAVLWPLEVGEHPAALYSLTVQDRDSPKFLGRNLMFFSRRSCSDRRLGSNWVGGGSVSLRCTPSSPAAMTAPKAR